MLHKINIIDLISERLLERFIGKNSATVFKFRNLEQ